MFIHLKSTLLNNSLINNIAKINKHYLYTIQIIITYKYHNNYTKHNILLHNIDL